MSIIPSHREPAPVHQPHIIPDRSANILSNSSQRAAWKEISGLAYQDGLMELMVPWRLEGFLPSSFCHIRARRQIELIWQHKGHICRPIPST